ncbi:dTDP-glucose 4,6-dehydratase [Kiloniella majae]|uniref:dTDP-glucose 4,6-dehydratase n=1 Tax=Kiloniella majae TaxID=1938558 RepID=UPI000A278AD2|nr:dTDP-glucose 4,6-dehydratase [Kiloniella majae]
MNILITGGAGFIGSHVVDKIVAHYKGANITVLDKLTYAANVNFILDHIKSGAVRLVAGDICDFDTVSTCTKEVDLLFHVAAESHVGRSFGNSIEFTKTNTLGTHVLLEGARQNKVRRFVHVSTDEVYGEVLDGAADENSPLHPNNPYSASKAAAEMILQGYIRSFDIPVITVRANNIFGIRQFPEKIIPKFITQLLTNQKLTLHGSGQHTRHYLAAEDFASALVTLADKAANHNIYNIGTYEEYSNLEIANLICNLMGRDPKDHITYVEDRPFNDQRYSVNANKIKTIGWAQEYSLTDRLPLIVDWYTKNQKLFPHNLDSSLIEAK